MAILTTLRVLLLAAGAAASNTWMVKMTAGTCPQCSNFPIHQGGCIGQEFNPFSPTCKSATKLSAVMYAAPVTKFTCIGTNFTVQEMTVPADTGGTAFACEEVAGQTG